MSIIFTESFDDGMAVAKWFEPPQLAFAAFTPPTARTGTFSGQWGQNSGRVFDLVFPDRPVAFTHGTAWRIPTGQSGVLGGLWYYSDRAYNIHLAVVHNPTLLRLEVRHTGFAGALLIASPDGSAPLNDWHYFELQATIDGAAGAVELWIDGVSQGSVSGVNTLSTNGGALPELAVWWSRATASYPRECLIDDIYYTDTVGGAPHNGRLGPVHVYVIYPNDNGFYSQQIGSDGNQIDNYQLVDEAPNPDDDVTYVQSATLLDKDTYNFEDAPPGANFDVLGVNLHLWARKGDGLARQIAPMIRTGGTDFVGAGQDTRNDYTIYTERWEQNPNTLAPWSLAEINALEAGQEVN